MKKVVTDQQKTTVKKVLDYIRRYWFYLGLSIVLAAVTVALTLYIPILTGRAVDLIITKGQVDFAGILVILERMAVVILLTAAAQWIMNACNNKITYNVIRDIRKEAFERIEHLPLKYIDSHSYGEVVSRVIADVDQFADGLLMGFTQFFTGIVTIFGTLIFMLTISVNITVAVVVITPLSLFVASFIAKKRSTEDCRNIHCARSSFRVSRTRQHVLSTALSMRQSVSSVHFLPSKEALQSDSYRVF